MKNKTVFITGSSSGIGQACAEIFAAKGANLILNARRKDRLENLQQKLQAEYPQQKFTLAVFDIQNLSSVQNYFSQEKPSVDILINNAGLAKGVDKVQDALATDWDQMIDTNIKGLLYVTRQVLPSMIKNKSGHIVNLGSVAGRFTYPGGAVYSATKFAVRAITEGLRMDLLGQPVRVTNIEPGMVETEFSEVRLNDKTAAKKVYEGMTPLSAQDIAETIYWCCDRPPHVNIQELIIYPTDQAHVGQVARRSL